LAVWLFAGQPRRDGVLTIGLDVEFDAILGARATGLSFANHRQRCRGRGMEHLDLGLVAHGFRKPGFKRGDIDNPGQCGSGLHPGIEIHQATVVAADLHAQHGGCRSLVRPDTQ
jgi:hypothetical protein